MSLAVRVIPCLDVAGGRVVKGVNFQNLRDAGDPVELAARYSEQGADELTFLDVTATVDDRSTTYDMVQRVAEQYRAGDNKGYIAGDGTISEFPADQRGEPVEFAGESIEGEPIDSGDLAGEVVVVNFWYAGCAPCRAEAPLLQEVSEEFEGDGATFVGVNVRDQAATAASFEENYGITYPSIIDVNDGAVQYAFAGDVPPAAGRCRFSQGAPYPSNGIQRLH